MLRLHGTPVLANSWGIFPYLRLGSWGVPMYSVMVFLALAAGAAVYVLQGERVRGGPSFALGVAGLLGGFLGAKLPYVCGNLQAYLHGVRDPELLFSGRTLLGGLLGGALAVRLVKGRLGIRTRKGDALVPSLGIGMAVGRLGCFFRGCCGGKVTALAWGVDFGDGLRRHPTQLLEGAFGLVWFAATFSRPKREGGVLFDLFMGSYFLFRFLVEFARSEQVVAWGLTSFQLVCIPGLLWSTLKLFRSRSHGPSLESPS